MTVHATAVLLGAGGLLVIGPSGAGKSMLALRLIDRGAMLVADDRVDLQPSAGGRLAARPPPALAGLIEIRGLGVLRMSHAPSAAIVLVLDLGRRPQRMPEPAFWTGAGAPVPLIGFDEADPAAPLRAEWAVALAATDRLWSADGC